MSRSLPSRNALWPAVAALALSLLAPVAPASAASCGWYCTRVKSDSPTVYHRLEEQAPTSGMTVSDSSAHNRVGAQFYAGPSGPSTTAGPIITENDNRAFKYGRVSTYGAGGDGSYTIELWVKTDSFTVPAGHAADFFFTLDPVFAQYHLRARAYGSAAPTNGTLVVEPYNGGTNDVTHSGPTTLIDGGWHHWVLTKDTTTNVARAYIDGVKYYENLSAGQDFDPTLNTWVLFGDAEGPAEVWTYDEFAIYPTALSQSRVQAHHAAATTSPPESTSAPVLTGQAKAGQILSASDGTWSGLPATFTYAYQWQIKTGSTWANIPSATGNTYSVTDADVGSRLRVRVRATNSTGTTAAFSLMTQPVVAQEPVSTAAPTFDGVPAVGETLTGSPGTWTGTPTVIHDYQWQRDSGSGWLDIPSATSSNYVLQTADGGASIRLRVTATNAGGSTVAYSAAVGPIGP